MSELKHLKRILINQILNNKQKSKLFLSFKKLPILEILESIFGVPDKNQTTLSFLFWILWQIILKIS